MFRPFRTEQHEMLPMRDIQYRKGLGCGIFRLNYLNSINGRLFFDRLYPMSGRYIRVIIEFTLLTQSYLLAGNSYTILISTRNLWSSIQTGIHVDAPPTSYIMLIPILLYHRFMGLNPEQDPKDYCFGFGRRSASRSFFIMCLLIVGLAEFVLAPISRTHRSGLTSPNLSPHSTSQKQSGQTVKLLFRW